MDTTQQNLSEDDRHTIATYVSDMLALEKHMGAPIKAQTESKDHQAYVEAADVFQKLMTMTTRHVDALEKRLEAVGGSSQNGLKQAWASLVGGGAAAVTGSRKSKVSKSLRDDYTALSLATISYTMLHATATGLGDTATASLAKSAMDDYAPLIIEISRKMPSVVLQELADDGENVDPGAAEITKNASQDTWNSN